VSEPALRLWRVSKSFGAFAYVLVECARGAGAAREDAGRSSAISRPATGAASQARGAVALAKGQLDEDQVELQTLAEFAKVSSESGKLELNLALPVQDLFDRMHLPCPGRDGGP